MSSKRERTVPVYYQERDHLWVLSTPGLQDLNCSLHSEWRSFERGRASSPCSLVLADDLSGDVALARMAGLPQAHRAFPTVLVTRDAPENLRMIARLPVSEIVWFRDAGTLLRQALDRVCSTAVLQQIAAVVEECTRFPPRLRTALVFACRPDRPVVSVAELCSAVSCDRSTLCRQWRAATDEPLRLQDALDWLLLLRVVAHRVAGRRWASIAAEFGVQERTLRRTAVRLSGMTLSELAAGGAAGVVNMFNSRFRNILHAEIVCNVMS